MLPEQETETGKPELEVDLLAEHMLRYRMAEHAIQTQLPRGSDDLMTCLRHETLTTMRGIDHRGAGFGPCALVGAAQGVVGDQMAVRVEAHHRDQQARFVCAEQRLWIVQSLVDVIIAPDPAHQAANPRRILCPEPSDQIRTHAMPSSLGRPRREILPLGSVGIRSRR